MPKKKGGTKRKSSKSRSARTVHHSARSVSLGEETVEKVLVENFVSLQKVMTNLSAKFDSLTEQISKLLELFEISAKTMAKKDFELGGSKEDREILKKMDTLLEQNKVIARGLTLLHEPESFAQPAMSIAPPRPMQEPPQQIQNVPMKRPVPQIQRPPQQINRPIQREPSMQTPEEAPTDFQSYQKSKHLHESSGSIFGATSPARGQKRPGNKEGF